MLGFLLFFSPLIIDEIEVVRTFDEEEMYRVAPLSTEDRIDWLSQQGLTLSFATALELSQRRVEMFKIPKSPLPNLKGLTISVTLNDLVMKYIKYFRGRGHYSYGKWYSRMGRYEELILPILDKYQLPRELIFQAMIESGFKNDAVSSASAVGIWQFVRRTGDSYGLRYDGWVDERRDFIAATEAAARHMRDLYARFNSYSLSLAAYNAGIGSVSRAISKSNTNDLFRIYRRGHLQGAGGIYVPKIMAAMIIAQDPAIYGFDKIKKESPLRFEIVEVPGGLELGVYARYAKVSRDQIEELNPSLRRGYAPPDAGGYPLRVPLGAKVKLEKSLKKLELKEPQLFYEHRVRFGEKLSDIAYSYYVSTRVLRQINELKHNYPEVGSVLLIPRNTSKQPREILTDTLLVAIDPSLQFSYEDRRLVYFPVRRPISVEQLASFFGVTPREVSLWNTLDPEATLQRGMSLRLYVPETFDFSTALLAKPSQVQVVDPTTNLGEAMISYASRRQERRIRHVKHKVRRGQTLRKIARKYRVSVKDIRAENNLKSRSSIYPGLVLKIPTLSTPKPRGRAARSKTKREEKRHRVRRGDTLWKIAKRYGVSMKSLRRRNRLRGRVRLKIGQIIRIP